MKKSFTLGAVSGITALAIGFPLAAQLAGAQDSSSAKSTDRGAFHQKVPLSQEDVEAMIERDNQFLLHVDAFVAIHKEAIQNHRIALQAAADIVDEKERNDAVKAAHEAMQAEVEEAIETDPELKELKNMRIGPGGPRKGHGKWRHGPGPEKLLEELGMTPKEFKAALDSGKTIEEIAEERGVTLPPRPPIRGMRFGAPDDASDLPR